MEQPLRTAALVAHARVEVAGRFLNLALLMGIGLKTSFTHFVVLHPVPMEKAHKREVSLTLLEISMGQQSLEVTRHAAVELFSS